MIANETLVAADGYEVALFPMPYLYMTQDEGGDFSHAGTYNIDFVGYNGSSVITNAPLYAPCSMRCRLAPPGGSNGEIWDSIDKVHLPNGQLDYLTLEFDHSNNPPYHYVGAEVSQGQMFYTTGMAGFVTGDHVHICVGQGAGGVLVQRPGGNWDLSNRIHMWEGLFVNDTTIIQGYGHDWKVWDGPTPTPTREYRKKFPWPVAWKNWPQFRLR